MVAIFVKVNTDANAEDEEMKYFSVRKGYTISCYYELPEMFIPYDAPFLIARSSLFIRVISHLKYQSS